MAGANFYKRIGDLELVANFREGGDLTIRRHNNDVVTKEIQIHGIEQLRDLQYAINRALEYATAKD